MRVLAVSDLSVYEAGHLLCAGRPPRQAEECCSSTGLIFGAAEWLVCPWQTGELGDMGALQLSLTLPYRMTLGADKPHKAPQGHWCLWLSTQLTQQEQPALQARGLRVLNPQL